MSHSHAQMVAWLLPLVAPVAPALRDAAHHQLIDERLEALQAAAQCGLEGLVAVEAAMTAVRLKPGEAPPALTGAQLIAEERQRQIDVHGNDAAEDSKVYGRRHQQGQLSAAAGCYALNASASIHVGYDAERHAADSPCGDEWPWSLDGWKPESPRADLIKAGALIAAQIDLLDYLEAQKAKESAA